MYKNKVFRKIPRFCLCGYLEGKNGRAAKHCSAIVTERRACMVKWHGSS